MEGAQQEEQIEVLREQKSPSKVADDDDDSVEPLMLPTSGSSDDEDDNHEDNLDDDSIPDSISEADSQAEEVLSGSESEGEMPFVPSPVRRRDSIERSGSSLRRSSPRKEQNDCDVKRSVSFSTVQIHEHRMVLGDNPSVSRGLPVALDSKAIRTINRTIDEFEDESPHRRNKKELRLSNHHRQHLLVQGGHSDESFRRVSEEIHSIKQHRKQILLEDREEQQNKLQQGEQHKNPFYSNKWIYHRKNKNADDNDDDDNSMDGDGKGANPKQKPVNRFLRRYVSKEGWVSRPLPKRDLLKSDPERQAPPRKTSSFLLWRNTENDRSTKESLVTLGGDQERNVPGRKPSFLRWSKGAVQTGSEKQGVNENWVSWATPRRNLLETETERHAPPRKNSSFLLWRNTENDCSTKESLTWGDQQRNLPGRKPSFLQWSMRKVNGASRRHSENKGNKKANETSVEIAGDDGKVTTASQDESPKPLQRPSIESEESLSAVTKWTNRTHCDGHSNRDKNGKVCGPKRTISSNRFLRRYTSKEYRASGEVSNNGDRKSLPRKTSSFLSWRTHKNNQANGDPLRIGAIQDEVPKLPQRLNLTDTSVLDGRGNQGSLKRTPERNVSFFQRASRPKNIKVEDPVIRQEEAGPKKKAPKRTKSLMQRIRRRRVEV